MTFLQWCTEPSHCTFWRKLTGRGHAFRDQVFEVRFQVKTSGLPWIPCFREETLPMCIHCDRVSGCLTIAKDIPMSFQIDNVSIVKSDRVPSHA